MIKEMIRGTKKRCLKLNVTQFHEERISKSKKEEKINSIMLEFFLAFDVMLSFQRKFYKMHSWKHFIDTDTISKVN